MNVVVERPSRSAIDPGLAVSFWPFVGVPSSTAGTPVVARLVDSVPVKATVLFPPLLMMFSVADFAPSVALRGARKLIDTWQDSPGRTGPAQPVGRLHEVAFVPVLVRLVTCRLALPVLVTVTVLVVGAVPRFRVPNANGPAGTLAMAMSGAATEPVTLLNTCFGRSVLVGVGHPDPQRPAGVGQQRRERRVRRRGASDVDAVPLPLDAQGTQPVFVSDLADVDGQRGADDSGWPHRG